MNDSLTEEPNTQQDKQQHPPLQMGFGFLPRLLNPGWFMLAFLLLKRCPKYFLKSAILLSFALTSPYIEFTILNMFGNSMQNHGPFRGVSDILFTFGPALIGLFILSIGALVSMFWGLGALLIAMTATCRTVLTVDPQHFGQDTASMERALNTVQDEGVRIFRHKKAYLAKVWLLYSLFMILPTLVMTVSSSVMMLGMPQMGGNTVLPMRMDLPVEMMLGSAIALGASVTVLTNYAMILFPFSSLTHQPASQAALRGFILTLKTLPAISIYSVIFFLLSSFLLSPVDLLLIYNPALVTGPAVTILFLLLKILWHALFFVYLTPISLLIPCEMVRGNIE